MKLVIELSPNNFVTKSKVTIRHFFHVVFLCLDTIFTHQIRLYAREGEGWLRSSQRQTDLPNDRLSHQLRVQHRDGVGF